MTVCFGVENLITVFGIGFALGFLILPIFFFVVIVRNKK